MAVRDINRWKLMWQFTYGDIYNLSQSELIRPFSGSTDEIQQMNIYKNNVVGKIVIINEEELSFKLQPPSFYGQKDLWDGDDKSSAVTLDTN